MAMVSPTAGTPDVTVASVKVTVTIAVVAAAVASMRILKSS